MCTVYGELNPSTLQEEICRRKTIGFEQFITFPSTIKMTSFACSNSTLVQMSLQLPWGYFQMATGLWLGPSCSGANSMLEYLTKMNVKLILFMTVY